MKSRDALHWFADIALSLVGVLSLCLIGLFLYEKSQSPTRYLKYYTVTPVRDHYTAGSKILFYSFSVSRKSVSAKWNEVVYCAGDDGVFYTHDTFDSASASYYTSTAYPLEVLNLLRGDPTGYETVRALRKWARASGYRAWRLGVDPPLLGSTCLVRHTITVDTPWFKIPLSDVIVSNPWTYGKTDQ